VTTYRTGRHNRGIIYRQSGPEPSDDDVMVAVLMPAETGLAAAIVAGLNQRERLINPPPPPPCERCGQPVLEAVGVPHHSMWDHGYREVISIAITNKPCGCAYIRSVRPAQPTEETPQP
jgi:hypothetical protein